MNKNNPNRKPKICFVCIYCYPLFNPNNKSIFGGSEVRVSQIAKELARRGNFRVSLIVSNHGQPAREIIDGVEVISWRDCLYWNVPEIAYLETLAKALAPLPENRSSSTSKLDEYEAPNQLPEEYNGNYSKSTQQTGLRHIYKQIIPWRVRIILQGLAMGIKDGNLHFQNSPSIKRSLSAFAATLINYTRRRLFTARVAFCHIGDEAVYPSSVKALEIADADIYVVPGNNYISAWTACYCAKRKKPYIMLSGSDVDFSQDIVSKPNEHDVHMNPNHLKAYAIKSAQAHIVQNELQAHLARQFGVEPVIIPNPISLERVFPKETEKNLVLWIGNTDERVKRASLMLEVIQKLPEYQFVMILTSVRPGDFEKWVIKSSHLSNLTSLTGIPFSEIEQYFARAKIFVSTSAFEGFPNTFLQAGKYGVPIVSLKVDPNEMISTHKCGLLCQDDVDQLSKNIRTCIENIELYMSTSQNIMTYVTNHHSSEIVIPAYEHQYQTVLRRRLHTR